MTDRFVYVHEPKTGGTFVTAVLLQVHGIKWTRWTQLQTTLRPAITWAGPGGSLTYLNNKHGTCNEAPARYRNRPFLATIRNPLDLYVSEYEFGWWKRPDMMKHYRSIADFSERFPAFPNLNFEEYVSLATLAFRDPSRRDRGSDSPGPMTERFVRYYCREPHEVMRRLESFRDAEVIRSNLHDVTFLRTRALNAQLHHFLGAMGYPAEAIAFVQTMQRVLPQGKGRPASQGWQSYYSTQLRDVVQQRESVLLELFPDFAA